MECLKRNKQRITIVLLYNVSVNGFVIKEQEQTNGKSCVRANNSKTFSDKLIMHCLIIDKTSFPNLVLDVPHSYI